MKRSERIALALGLSLLLHAGVLWVAQSRTEVGDEAHAWRGTKPTVIVLRRVLGNVSHAVPTPLSSTPHRRSTAPSRAVAAPRSEHPQERVALAPAASPPPAAVVAPSTPAPVAPHVPSATEGSTSTAGDGSGRARGGQTDSSGTTAGAEVSPSCWSSIAATLRERAQNDVPAAIRRRGLTGEVELAFSIDASGSATNIDVSQSSGNALLDEAATSLLKSRLPAVCGGRGRWRVRFVKP